MATQLVGMLIDDSEIQGNWINFQVGSVIFHEHYHSSRIYSEGVDMVWT